MGQRDLQKLLDFLVEYKNEPPDKVVALLVKALGLVMIAGKTKDPKLGLALKNELAILMEFIEQ